MLLKKAVKRIRENNTTCEQTLFVSFHRLYFRGILFFSGDCFQKFELTLASLSGFPAGALYFFQLLVAE